VRVETEKTLRRQMKSFRLVSRAMDWILNTAKENQDVDVPQPRNQEDRAAKKEDGGSNLVEEDYLITIQFLKSNSRLTSLQVKLWTTRSNCLGMLNDFWDVYPIKVYYF